VLSAVSHLTRQVDEWLGDCFTPGAVSLDLGCGPGQLIAAAAQRGHSMMGIDVRLLWLLAAKRVILAHGGQPILAAALAEHMPLRSASVKAVVSLDVIEHVADVAAYLAEIDRVTASGGTVALSTPNRYSLAAEPHVGVWGVGWVPRRWQKQYVRWRKNVDYPYTCLLSVGEMHSLLREYTRLRPFMLVPQVPDYEIRRFPSYRKILARVYNVAARVGALRLPLLAIGPFFRVVAVKTATSYAREVGKPPGEMNNLRPDGVPSNHPINHSIINTCNLSASNDNALYAPDISALTTQGKRGNRD
jgi:ubiquinone/menaquinone biosynthesis C-methylase UbiE